MTGRLLMASLLSLLGLVLKAQDRQQGQTPKVVKTDAEWKKTLTPSQYQILRQKGTERPYTGKYDKFYKNGVFTCAGCGAKLYSSKNKFDSHCGWPSFDRGFESNLIYKNDYSHGMHRTEVMCANCGGHLGHIFDDGPRETTGKRHCINSESLNFLPVFNDKTVPNS